MRRTSFSPVLVAITLLATTADVVQPSRSDYEWQQDYAAISGHKQAAEREKRQLQAEDGSGLPVNTTLITDDFLPFGSTHGDSRVPTLLDGSTGSIQLETDIIIFGSRQNRLYVNTNGVLSFGRSFIRYSSFGCDFNSILSPPIIAPFWDDVDIRRGGTIYYRQDFNSSIADQVQQDIYTQFPDTGFFYPSLVFVATWDRVAAFRTNLMNTFQVVLASDGVRTFVRFNYGDIQWGGSRTLIGISVGDRVNFITHPTSLSSSVLSLDNTIFHTEVDDLLSVNFTDDNFVGFTFNSSIYTVSEDDGFAELTIVKISSSTTENITTFIHISFYSINEVGSAQAGLDYMPHSYTVTFGPDEDEQSIQVPIINDSFRERSEIFYGQLRVFPSVQYGRCSTQYDVAIIEISYNDCDCSCNTDDEQNCTCHDGFFGNGFICPDDDECKNGLDDCDILNANCTNTVGSFECTCKDGFFGDGKTCISAAIENQILCPCNSSKYCFSFEDDNGTETCGCFTGFQQQVDDQGNQMCIDIDECDSFDCGNGTCINVPGSYICTCPPGYIFNLEEQQCIDLDECIGGIHDCSENANCFNTEGSYDCICHSGFIGNGITCLNSSSCETLNCSQLCVNTTGLLSCACHPGYYLNTLGECEDLDECKLQLFSCDTRAECRNTIGSYECECISGYYGSGKICNDIDECATGLYINDCPRNSNCHNSDGNFSCGIAPDIELQEPERPNHNLSYAVGIDFCLEDIDSVWPNVTLNCLLGNEPDPFPDFSIRVERILISGTGFETLQTQMSVNDSILQLNETNLQSLFDVDTESINVTCIVSNTFGNDTATTAITVCGPTECQNGVTNDCTQTCTRSTSNETCYYECGCNDGYQLNLDYTTCDDVDECNITCLESEKETCSNTIGSYMCDCKVGYQMNETSQVCEDIDECQRPEYYGQCTQQSNKECVNTQGSHSCQCKAGYQNSTSGACIDINECASNPCHPNATCMNGIGMYTCECDPGYTGNGSVCQDINECASNPCHPNATCMNGIGMYTCECDPGYTGNGSVCQATESLSQPPNIMVRNSELSTTGIISGTLGAVTFLLAIGIVVVIVYTYYYCNVRKSSSKESVNNIPDFYSLPEVNANEYSGSYHRFDSPPRIISVQSSYKLKLPPYLIIHAADIQLGEPIGQGEFGIVYKGHIVKEQGTIVTDTVAIKTLKGLYDRSTVRDMLKECAKMYNFSHSNVLTLRGICLDGGAAPYIIMPFMANGSLLAYLKKNRETLVVSLSNKDEDDVLAIQKRLMDMCIQVAKGMEYLASVKMVHRDLAARNCMIDMNFIIKVADFGLAESIGTREYFRQDKSSHIKLPWRWLAPESMDDYMFSEKSDVWAYGVTCWEIFSGGKVPYGGVDVTDLSQLLANGHRLEKPNNDACSDQLYKFILQCWELEPENRPKFANIVVRLSQSLEAMAGYLDIGAFREATVETSECREASELDGEERSLCQASSEEKCQDEATVPCVMMDTEV